MPRGKAMSQSDKTVAEKKPRGKKTSNRKKTSPKVTVKKNKESKAAEPKLVMDIQRPQTRIFQEETTNNNREYVYFEKQEQQKRTVMWFFVSVFMTIIVVLWGFNMKSMFGRAQAENASESELSKRWEETNKDLSEAMDNLEINLQDFKEQFSQINNQTEETTESQESNQEIFGDSGQATSTSESIQKEASSTNEQSDSGELTTGEVEELRQQIKLLGQELE